jgi:hypothetical protein
MVETAQLSVALATNVAAFTVAVPVAFKATFTGPLTNVNKGAVLSTTVTAITTGTEVFPLPSTAVTVILFKPKLEQSKVDLLNVNVAGPQLSVAVAKPAGIEALPAAFRGKVKEELVNETTGLMASTTNTFFTMVETLPEASVAVIVTGTLPLPAQFTTVGEITTAIAPEAVQLSITDCITSATRMVALPVADKGLVTVPGTTLIVGAIPSWTITLTLEGVTLPDASVAVTVTTLLPKFVQLNTLGEYATVTGEQLSEVLTTTAF